MINIHKDSFNSMDMMQNLNNESISHIEHDMKTSYDGKSLNLTQSPANRPDDLQITPWYRKDSIASSSIRVSYDHQNSYSSFSTSHHDEQANVLEHHSTVISSGENDGVVPKPISTAPRKAYMDLTDAIALLDETCPNPDVNLSTAPKTPKTPLSLSSRNKRARSKSSDNSSNYSNEQSNGCSEVHEGIKERERIRPFLKKIGLSKTEDRPFFSKIAPRINISKPYLEKIGPSKAIEKPFLEKIGPSKTLDKFSFESLRDLPRAMIRRTHTVVEPMRIDEGCADDTDSVSTNDYIFITKERCPSNHVNVINASHGQQSGKGPLLKMYSFETEDLDETYSVTTEIDHEPLRGTSLDDVLNYEPSPMAYLKNKCNVKQLPYSKVQSNFYHSDVAQLLKCRVTTSEEIISSNIKSLTPLRITQWQAKQSFTNISTPTNNISSVDAQKLLNVDETINSSTKKNKRDNQASTFSTPINSPSTDGNRTESLESISSKRHSVNFIKQKFPECDYASSHRKNQHSSENIWNRMERERHKEDAISLCNQRCDNSLDLIDQRLIDNRRNISRKALQQLHNIKIKNVPMSVSDATTTSTSTHTSSNITKTVNNNDCDNHYHDDNNNSSNDENDNDDGSNKNAITTSTNTAAATAIVALTFITSTTTNSAITTVTSTIMATTDTTATTTTTTTTTTSTTTSSAIKPVSNSNSDPDSIICNTEKYKFVTKRKAINRSSEIDNESGETDKETIIQNEYIMNSKRNSNSHLIISKDDNSNDNNLHLSSVRSILRKQDRVDSCNDLEAEMAIPLRKPMKKILQQPSQETLDLLTELRIVKSLLKTPSEEGKDWELDCLKPARLPKKVSLSDKEFCLSIDRENSIRRPMELKVREIKNKLECGEDNERTFTREEKFGLALFEKQCLSLDYADDDLKSKKTEVCAISLTSLEEPTLCDDKIKVPSNSPILHHSKCDADKDGNDENDDDDDDDDGSTEKKTTHIMNAATKSQHNNFLEVDIDVISPTSPKKHNEIHETTHDSYEVIPPGSTPLKINEKLSDITMQKTMEEENFVIGKVTDDRPIMTPKKTKCFPL